MGKRSDFTRMKNDSYDTPTECVSHLVRMMALIEGHKYPGEPRRFVEPCAGRGALVDELESRYGWVCTDKFDVEPRAPGVKKADFTKVTLKRLAPASAIVVTNPPWTRLLLHALIDRLIEAEAEAYLLVDGNWLFTMQARFYMKHISHVGVIGRVRWIPKSPHLSKDDAIWIRIAKGRRKGPMFLGRV